MRAVSAFLVSLAAVFSVVATAALIPTNDVKVRTHLISLLLSSPVFLFDNANPGYRKERQKREIERETEKKERKETRKK
jgi:hypothetical protein